MALRRRKRDPAEPPRFYVYISDAKVDMLLGQIPAGLLERLAAEVTVDLKILSVKVATRDAPETRFSRVALVTRFLQDQNLVGRASDSAQYFATEASPMRWGLIGRNDITGAAGIAYFTGDSDSARVFLTGSPHHILGFVPAANVDHGQPGSYAPSLNLFWDVYQDWDEPPEGPLHFDIAEDFRKNLRRPVEDLSFIARRIYQHTDGSGTLRVLGSPIWVAASPAPATTAGTKDP